MKARLQALAVFVVFAFVLVGFPAAAHAGSSDELVLPPASSCTAPAFTTTPLLDDQGYNISNPNLGDGAGGLATRATFPVSFGPGVVSLDEIITWDAHVDRDTNLDQTNERVLIEFSLDGAVVATSGPTADLADGPLSAWEINDLGTLALPEGADSAAVIHASGTAAINSVVVTSICMTFAEDAPVLPEPEPACDDDPETPEPAEGCPEPEPEPPSSSCEDGSPDPECDLEPVPEPACDDDPETPEPAEGCPDPEPEPEPEPAACDDDPETPEPAEGCDVLPEPPAPEPEPEPGDQNPELAITGAYSGSMAAGAMILLILGGSAAFVARRNED